MTFKDFLNKYNGQYVEVAGSANAQNQCVDLANAYLREVLNQPIVEWTNARDFPSKLQDNFTWIPNSPTGIPEEGDLMVWQHNQYGHIAMFVEGDVNSFRSFDQNYPTGSPAHIQNHSYTNPPVAGWLRFKGDTPSCQVELEKCVTDRNSHWDFIIKVADKLGIAHNKDIILAEIEKLLTVEDKLMDKEKQLEIAKETINRLETENKEKEGKLEELKKTSDELSKAVKEAITENQIQKQEIEQLKQTTSVDKMDWWDLIKRGIEKLVRGR